MIVKSYFLIMIPFIRHKIPSFIVSPQTSWVKKHTISWYILYMLSLDKSWDDPKLIQSQRCHDLCCIEPSRSISGRWWVSLMLFFKCLIFVWNFYRKIYQTTFRVHIFWAWKGGRVSQAGKGEQWKLGLSEQLLVTVKKNPQGITWPPWVFFQRSMMFLLDLHWSSV